MSQKVKQRKSKTKPSFIYETASERRIRVSIDQINYRLKDLREDLKSYKKAIKRSVSFYDINTFSMYGKGKEEAIDHLERILNLLTKPISKDESKANL